MSSPQSGANSHYVLTGNELLTEKFYDLTLAFIVVSKEITNCSLSVTTLYVRYLSVTTLYVRYNLILTCLTCSVTEQDTLLCVFSTEVKKISNHHTSSF